MLRWVCLLCSFLFAAASPVGAEPLAFGSISAEQHLAADPELAGCDRSICTLKRTTFGGLPIERSELHLSPEGRPVSLLLLLQRSDHDTAYRMLVGRYGPATKAGTSARWSRFDRGAGISIEPRGRASAVTFSFPENAVPAADAGLDQQLALSLALCSMLGLVAGWAIQRLRRRRRIAPAAAPTSMREALERRVRHGGDWHL